MNKTTRARGRWDLRDSVLNECARGILGTEQKNSSARSGQDAASAARATLANDEAVLAMAMAMNEFSNAIPPRSASPAQTARMNAAPVVDTVVIESFTADEFLYRLFNR